MPTPQQFLLCAPSPTAEAGKRTLARALAELGKLMLTITAVTAEVLVGLLGGRNVVNHCSSFFGCNGGRNRLCIILLPKKIVLKLSISTH